MANSFSDILVATGNKGKLTEISALLKEINIRSLSLDNFGEFTEPEENGATFKENSLIKAKYYAKKTNMVSLADDSGLCIADLDNRPGIYSARFAIDEITGKKDFAKTFKKIFDELESKGIKKDQNIRAFFVCSLTIYDPRTDFNIDFEGRVDGRLIYPPKGNLGFGYDPIFIKDKMNLTFGEIDRFKKDKISHRFVAFEKMTKWLKENN